MKNILVIKKNSHFQVSMASYLKYFLKHPKLWFYFRKFLFQGLLPSTIAFLTLIDIFINVSSGTSIFINVYFYSSLLLFLYTTINIIIMFIFNICADSYVVIKNVKRHMKSLVFVGEPSSQVKPPKLMLVRSIYKPRYSDSMFLKRLNNFCDLLGIDSPIIIPSFVIRIFTNHSDAITNLNDISLLQMTLDELQKYPIIKKPHLDNEKSYTEFLKSDNTNETEPDYRKPFELLNHTNSDICRNLEFNRVVHELQIDLFQTEDD
jgi:hypothetical protein